MKKIVHLGKHYFPETGGIETATQNLAEAGVSLGYKVVCHVTGKARSRGARFERNGVLVRRALTLGRWLSTPLAPRFLVPRNGARDVVHVHLPNPFAEASLLLGTSFGGRSGLMPFVHALPFRGRGLGRLWYRLVTRPLLRRSKRVLVSDIRLLDAFPELQQFRDKISVVPFGTEVISREEFCASWAADARKKTVIALGRLVGYKGYEDLLHAWAGSRANEAGYQLLLVGDGPLREALQAQAVALGVAATVKILTGQSDAQKRELLLRASLFVMSSRDDSETFGIAALEALAHGLPLVCSNLRTGLANLARGGECGAIFPAGNVLALRRAIDETLFGSQSLSAIGARNRDFAEENFSKRALAERYASLLADSQEL